jgi:hypothetical protein
VSNPVRIKLDEQTKQSIASSKSRSHTIKGFQENDPQIEPFQAQKFQTIKDS